MEREVALARQYREKLLKKRTSFSPNIESAISKAFGSATMFDIETGGLQSSDPIYEMGFQHGIDKPKFTHTFVKPTNLEGTGPGNITGFTENLLKSREATSPTIRQDILGSTLSQQDAGLMAHSQLAGRDIWVQNLGFERRSLQERISKDAFTAWARDSKLESFSPGGGIYTSTPNVKRAIVEANSARGNMTSVDTYLSKWSNVFSEMDTALQNRQPGVTRAFDMLDLTRSVFAMAQQSEQGYLTKTGELFAGTSIEALSQAYYGIPELHTALGDSALQGELTRFLYGTGKMLQEGVELGDTQKEFFRKIGAAQGVHKQRNLTKNIINTFKKQQEFLGEQAIGNYNQELLKDARIDTATSTYTSNMEVLQPDGTYATEKFTRIGRNYDNPRYSTDIEEVVEAWKQRDSYNHGIQVNYDQAMRDARQYIDPFQEKLNELGGDRLATLKAMEETSESVHKQINDTVSDAFASGKGAKQSWIKSNWKLALGVGAAIGLAGYMFSGSDDEYNYIEGMRHGGFSGSSRKYNTDFGSGWQGLKAIGEGLKGFVKQYPKTTMMMGAGFGVGMSTYHHEKGEGGILNSMGSMAKGLGISAAATLIAPPLMTMASAGLAARAAGGGMGGIGKLGIAAFKSNLTMLKATFGAYKRVHTGASAKEMFADAAKKGIDVSFGAQSKRFAQGIYDPASKAAKHTAEWLNKNWAPAAERFDPVAMGLAALSGYEAAHIGGDAVNLDLGGVAKGALMFAGAKYAYMGYHHRDAVKKFWQTSNRRDKLIVGSTAFSAAQNVVSAIPEFLHANFAYARYGIKPKQFYERFGSELYSGVTSRQEEFFKHVEDVVPHLSENLAKAAEDLVTGGKKAAGEAQDWFNTLTPEKIRASFNEAATDIKRGMSGKKTWEVPEDADEFERLWTKVHNDRVANEKSKFFDDGKDSIVGNWIHQKLKEADENKIYETLQRIKSRSNRPLNPKEGMGHSGFAGATRKHNTDFGSPWNALRGLTRAGETFEQMLSSKGFQEALTSSKVVQTKYTDYWTKEVKIVDDLLGKGEFGEATLRRGTFRGQEFNFVRKKGRIGEHEVEALKAMEGLNTPTYYGGSVTGPLDADNARLGYMDIEYFRPLSSGSAARSAAALTRQQLKEMIEGMHSRGYSHGDLHGNNLVWVDTGRGKGEFGVIDWGLAKPTSPGDPRAKADLRRAKGTFVERMRPYVDSFTPEAHKQWRSARRAKLARLKETEGWADMSDAQKMKALGIDAARQEVVIRRRKEAHRRIDKRINPIDGMPHEGFAGATRKEATDFGSPWQGLNPGYSGMVASVGINSWEVEDADTVNVMLNGSNKMTLRLAGIDAPEIQHGDSYASGKVFQNQPFGQESTQILQNILSEQSSVQMLIDPTADSTYGRSVAMLFGDDGLNINLELVKQGAAASLPFGKASDRMFASSEFNKAQDEAYRAKVGMWNYDGWRRAKEAQRKAKRKITHNSFTDLERLYSNFRTSAIAHRIRNPDAQFSQMMAAGGRDDFNIHEGLMHGWAQSSRQANLGDFGSGYRIDKVIDTMRKSTKVRRKLMRGQYAANTHSRRMMDPKNWTNHHVG